MLLEQACGLVSVDGGGVGRASVLLLLDDALDDALADVAAEGDDGT